MLADEGANRGHRTLAEKAFETLHWAIITGRLRPGARLPIEEVLLWITVCYISILVYETVKRWQGSGRRAAHAFFGPPASKPAA